MDTSPVFLAFDLAARLFSPYDLNPMGGNPLRDILADSVDFVWIAKSPIRLFVTATNDRTGRGRVFRNAELTPDVLLASACLPTLFQAVEIEGDASKVWKSKIEFRKLDIASPEPLPIGPTTVIGDDVGFSRAT